MCINRKCTQHDMLLALSIPTRSRNPLIPCVMLSGRPYPQIQPSLGLMCDNRLIGRSSRIGDDARLRGQTTFSIS